MVDHKTKVSRLLDTEIFGSLPEDQLLEIAQVVQDQIVPAGTVIYRQGDPGDSYYIIHSGRIRVFLSSEDGVKTDLNHLGPGASFGEIALLTEEPRTADIETIEETHLFVLTKDEFDGVLKKHPAVFREFIKHMSEMLKHEDRRIQEETELEYQTTRLSFSDFIFIGVVICLFAVIFNFNNPNRINVIPELHKPDEVTRVELTEAKKKYDGGKTLFIDARPDNFYEKLHIKGAINIPLEKFDLTYMFVEEDLQEAEELIVYGRSISALYDEKVVRKLLLLGHKNAKIMEAGPRYKSIPLNMVLTWGGLKAWENRGYPVEEGSE